MPDEEKVDAYDRLADAAEAVMDARATAVSTDAVTDWRGWREAHDEFRSMIHEIFGIRVG